MTTTTATPIRIVLADDDEDDCFLIGRALARISDNSDVRSVRNGEELIKLLRESGNDAGAALPPWPDLILLDLNMPRMDGREALAAIKSDPVLRRIPTIVLTTSSASQDVARCYELGVNSYLVKPRAFEALVDVMRRLMNYWTELVLLPDSDTRRMRR